MVIIRLSKEKELRDAEEEEEIEARDTQNKKHLVINWLWKGVVELI